MPLIWRQQAHLKHGYLWRDMASHSRRLKSLMLMWVPHITYKVNPDRCSRFFWDVDMHQLSYVLSHSRRLLSLHKQFATLIIVLVYFRNSSVSPIWPDARVLLLSCNLYSRTVPFVGTASRNQHSFWRNGTTVLQQCTYVRLSEAGKWSSVGFWRIPLSKLFQDLQNERDTS